MTDTWPGSEEEPSVSTGKRKILNLVEENLRNEIGRLRGRRPHAQLGVDVGATPAQIQRAFARQMRQYDPPSFQPFGLAAVQLAEQIVQMMCAARDQLLSDDRSFAGKELSKLRAVMERPPWWRRLLTG